MFRSILRIAIWGLALGVGLFGVTAIAGADCIPYTGNHTTGSCGATGIIVNPISGADSCWEAPPEHHGILLSTQASDIDHCCPPIEDKAETMFTAAWSIVDRPTAAQYCGLHQDPTLSPQWENGSQLSVRFGANKSMAGNYKVELVVEDTPGGGDATGNDGPSPAVYKWVEVKPPRPINFTHTMSVDDANIHVEATWASSCGHLAHLDDCLMSEYVDYPGDPYDYTWPSPMSGTVDDPDINDPPFSAVAGGGSDDHESGPIDTAHPAAADFSATQTYRYKLHFHPAHHAMGEDQDGVGNWPQVDGESGPFTIRRVTYFDPDPQPGQWYYKIVKSGDSQQPDFVVITPFSAF